MLFALICTDKAGQAEVRLRTRPDHLAYLQGLGDAVKFAGPFLDDAGQMTGSLIVIEAPDRNAAEVIAQKDPYARAGLFQNVDIRGWRWAFKNPELQ